MDEHLIPPSEAHRLARDGEAILIDVREEIECSKSGLGEHAINIPLQSGNFADQVGRTISNSNHASLILMCKSGMRSNIAYEMLLNAGFKDLRQVSGGFDRWDIDGLPKQSMI